MKVTKFFGLWILSVLCVLSCTDEEQGTGNIVPNVATAPVKLSLDATPMRGTVSTTRTRGDNSLDLVLGEEAGKTVNTAGTRAGTLTDAQEDAINDICVFQFGNADGKLKYSEYASLTDGQLTANISLASGVGTCTVYVLANVGDLTQKVSYGSALADFKKFAAEVSSGKGTGQNLPMCGYKTDFNSETDNASLTVHRGRLYSDFRQADERGKETLLRRVGNHRSDCCGTHNLYERQHQVHRLVCSGKQGWK